MNAYRKNNWFITGTAFVLLGLFYGLCRYVFFPLHGMKAWPAFLGGVCFAVLVLSALRKKNLVCLITACGYLFSFGIALLCNSDGVDAGNGRTNNMWLLWAAGLAVCILVGLAVQTVSDKKKRNL